MISSNNLRLLLISSLLCIFSLKATSLNYFWIGNSGNWTELNHWATTSGGTTLHTQIPTALDDVFFDANSFTIPGQAVHFDALTMLAHNINWTSVTNTPSMSGLISNSIRIYGSLTLVPAMTMNFGGPVYFEAITTGQTITSAGKTFTNEVAFNGIGGGWTLQDAFFSNNKISLNAGVLSSNNQTVTAAQVVSISNTTRQLNMGTSVFTLFGYSAWQIQNTGFTVQAGTSVINLTSPAATFQGNTIGTDTYYDINFAGPSDGTISGAGNFHDVVFSGPGHILNTGSFHNVNFHSNGSIDANNIYNNLSFTAGCNYLLGAGFTQTINGTFNATGTCALPINIFSNFQGFASTISHPPATVNVGFVNLRDIHATGGANFLAANSNDLTNNTGWTFVPIGIQNFYWIGNEGNWDDGNHWSHSSGGPASGCTPTPLDNVFFDANSFSLPAQTVFINILTSNCRNMDWTGVTNTPKFSSTLIYNNLNIYGSLKFVPGMNMQFNGTVFFQSGNTGQTITTAGRVFLNEVKFNGAFGGWTLQDTFNSDSTIIFNCGTLNTNDQTVNADIFLSSEFFPRVLNMGSSVFNLREAQAWMLGGGNITFNCGTSVINLTGENAVLRNNTEEHNTYYNVNFTGPGSGTITGTAYFHDVSFSAKGIVIDSCRFHTATFLRDADLCSNNVYDDLHFSAGSTYKLWMNFTQKINGTFDATGTCGSLITVTSNIPDSASFISRLSGAATITNTVLRDIHSIGVPGSTASNSIDLGNNIGWTFSSPGAHNLYWIGNSGNWEDGAHWSFTSGGTASGCAPTPLDNVFFDANSFSISNQTVLINITTAYCRSMDWTGSLHKPTFKSAPGIHTLNIYGSLTFVPPAAMTMIYDGNIHFEATTAGQTITTGTQAFTGEIEFNGVGGGWTLMDRLATELTISLNNGTLNTNNKSVEAYTFISVLHSTRVLNMGASVFSMSGGTAWMIASPGITINSGTSVINCSNDNVAQFNGTDGPVYTYYDVNFGPVGLLAGSCNFHNVRFASNGMIFSPCHFNKADFHANGNILADNVYDSLLFTAGYVYTLSKNTTQTINETFTASGTCGALIYINSDTPDSTATISHPPGNVNISYATLRDIHATGGATFVADNSLDLGNNTGWTINAPANPNLYWIGNGGSWTNGNHWSLTSGGPPSGCIPSAINNVIFDANSFTLGGQSVSIVASAATCRNMTWTGVTNTPIFHSPTDTNKLYIYGSLTFDAGMVLDLAGRTNFEAVTNGNAITMNGIIFSNDIWFNGSGQWIFQDGFTANNILFNNGTLNTNGQVVTLNSFLSSTITPRTLNMGASVFNLYADNAWKVENTGLTIHSGTSVINCISVYAGFFDNCTPVHTYNDVHFTGAVINSITGTSNFHNVDFAGKGYIYQPNTFNDLTFYADGEIQSNNTFHDLNFTAEHNYILWEGSTQTVNHRWFIQGTCTAYILLQTNNAGFFATVSCAADSVFGHNIHLRDIHCTGTAAFMAYNSVDLGGNAGWNFSVLPPLTNVGSIIGPTTICPGTTSVTYQVTAVQGAINYQWTVPTGATITSGQGTNTITVDFGSVVTGNFTVQACGGCGCSNTSISAPIILSTGTSPALTLTATPGNSICSGTTVNFTATATGTGSATVVYNFQVNNTSVQTGSSNTWSSSTLVNADEVVCIITSGGSGCFTNGPVSSNAISFTVLPGLTAVVSLAANPGTDICSGTAVTFTATATNTATATVTYDFKINGTSVQSSNLNSYTSSTLADGDVVTCTIILTNGTGICFSSTEAISNSLTIHATSSVTPTVTIVADPGTTVCITTAVTFTATAFAPGATAINYDFKINGTSVQSSTLNTYTTSTLAEGDIITCAISLSGTGSCFTSTEALSNSLVMHLASSITPTVSIDANPATSLCPATPVTFTATAFAPGATAINYDFKINGSSVQSSNANTYSTSVLTEADIVTCAISLSGTSSCFTTTEALSNSLVMHLASSITPTVSIDANPATTICPATPVTFTATAFAPGATAINYDFKINGSSVQSSNANTYSTSVLAEGAIVTCTISLTGTSSCFTATEALSNQLTIHLSSSITPTVTIASNAGTTVCTATAVTFTATANAPGAASINYDFNVNGTSVQNSSSNIYTSTVLNGDVITCIISITGGNCLASNTATSNSITMTVDPNSGNVNVHAGTDVIITAGETVQLNASADAGTYLWTPSTGLSATNILDPVAAPIATTTYVLTITNASGCSASDDILITVKDIPINGCTFDPMIAFTPNGDGINDKWIVYQGNCNLTAHATVFNRYGQIVFESQEYQNDWQGTYKGKPLPDGTYYFYIEYNLGNGRKVFRKNNVTILR